MLIRTFLFHKVEPSEKQIWSHALSPKMFEKCLNFISKRYQIETLETLVLERKSLTRSKKPFACISFDDGYKNNIQYAAPILARFKAPASFYINTSCVTHRTLPWQEQFNRLFQLTKKKSLQLDIPSTGKVNVSFSSDRDKGRFADSLYIKLYQLNIQSIDWVLTQLYANFDDVCQEKDYMMSWDDIKELSNFGYEIGSHTHRHIRLSKVEKEVVLRDEIILSRKAIQNHCGSFPKSMSYPFGYIEESIPELAKEVGYKMGVGVGQRFYRKDKDSIFRIPRMDVYAQRSWLPVYMRMTGTTERLKNLFGRNKQRYLST